MVLVGGCVIEEVNYTNIKKDISLDKILMVIQNRLEYELSKLPNLNISK